jgi:hypothetical protein
MSTIYELIGRLVVRLAWNRFGDQIKVAGGVLAVLALAGGYLLANRRPPEG